MDQESVFKTNEVKKGNYSSMNGFVIVPKKIMTDYKKKIGIEDKQKILIKRIDELTKLLASVDKLSKTSQKESPNLNPLQNDKLSWKNKDSRILPSPEELEKTANEPRNVLKETEKERRFQQHLKDLNKLIEEAKK